MNRHLVYPGQIPLDSDLLNVAKDAYVGLAKMAEAVIGNSPVLAGFAVTPTSPASGTVTIGPGQIYLRQEVDATDYSSLGQDTSTLVKQGLLLAPYTPSASLFAAPGAGQSINYLVQVGYLAADTNTVVLPYYNSANPTMAWSGPDGSASSQATVRADQAVVSIVPGAAAATGTQITPAPSSGCVGAWVVTVTNGSTISSGDIAVYSAASFIGNQPGGFTLNAVAPLASPAFTGNPTAPTQGAGDNSSRLASTAYVDAAARGAGGGYGADSGTVNVLAISISPTPAAQAVLTGLPLRIKVANAVTGSCTLAVSGLPAQPVVHGDGTAIAAGEIPAGAIITVIYDGSNYQLQSVALSVAGLSGEIKMWPGTAAPIGYLECDGQAVSRTTYALLFAAIGTTFGIGDGSSTFNLPDLRGMFVRGWDHGAGVDSGRTLGSTQQDALQNVSGYLQYINDGSNTPNGAFSQSSTGSASMAYGGGDSFIKNVNFSLSNDSSARTAAETRPKNVALMFIIKT